MLTLKLNALYMCCFNYFDFVIKVYKERAVTRQIQKRRSAIKHFITVVLDECHKFFKSANGNSLRSHED